MNKLFQFRIIFFLLTDAFHKEQFLKERPFGSCVLRVGDDAAETGKSPYVIFL